MREIQDASLSLSMGRRVPTCDSCHMQEVPDKRGHLHSRGSRAVGEKAVTSSTIGHCYISDMCRSELVKLIRSFLTQMGSLPVT